MTSTPPTNPDSALPLLQKYGFDRATQQQLLCNMGLSDADLILTRRLHDQVIAPNISLIIDKFYAYLMQLPSMRRFLPENLKRLKRTQAEYLLSFGINFNTPYYFEYRLRVGIAHERVGLTLDLYQAAYRHMTSLIIGTVPETIRATVHECEQIVNLILKVAALDMALAIHTYYYTSINSLKESIQQLSDQQQELTVEIQYDVLTSVYSRRYLLDQLTHMVDIKNRRGDQQFCIAMIDLDFFKKVNDTFGHLVGDQILQHISKLMRQAIRGVDKLGRYGGEEFLIIFAGATIDVAKQVAERMRSKIADTPLKAVNQNISVTVSIGITEYRNGDTTETLIQRADEALYAAKRSGRNQIQIHK